jgi:hypothetical protein
MAEEVEQAPTDMAEMNLGQPGLVELGKDGTSIRLSGAVVLPEGRLIHGSIARTCSAWRRINAHRECA